MTAASPIALEPASQQVADAFSKPPFLYDMTPADARMVLEDAQSGPVSKLPVDEEWITVPARVGDVRVRIIRPKGATAALALMAKERGDVTFVQQPMYYPVTDAAMSTASHEQFATGYDLTGKAMQWSWDAYTTDPAQRCATREKPTPPSSAQQASP